MYGQNPVRKARDYDESGMTLRVVEVFNTVQGEGPFVGRSAVFVRTAGCNLRCWFCDTDFESNARDVDVDALVQEIVQATAARGHKLVVLTGGEPMLQNLWPLCWRLFELDYDVQIETAGTIFPYDFPQFWGFEHACRLTFVCSPKTTHVHKRIAELCRDWKYIVGADTQVGVHGQPLDSCSQEGVFLRDAGNTEQRMGTVYYQPRDDYDATRNAANVRRAVELVHAKPGSRLSVQVHKVAGLP